MWTCQGTNIIYIIGVHVRWFNQSSCNFYWLKFSSSKWINGFYCKLELRWRYVKEKKRGFRHRSVIELPPSLIQFTGTCRNGNSRSYPHTEATVLNALHNLHSLRNPPVAPLFLCASISYRRLTVLRFITGISDVSGPPPDRRQSKSVLDI